MSPCASCPSIARCKSRIELKVVLPVNHHYPLISKSRIELKVNQGNRSYVSYASYGKSRIELKDVEMLPRPADGEG